MAVGVGIVCLRPASTVSKDNSTIWLVLWLGAKRNGMVDRTTETVTLKTAIPAHPIFWHERVYLQRRVLFHPDVY